MRVRLLEDQKTHDVAAVEARTGDIAQALALVSRCQEQGIELPPVLVVLEGPHRRAAVRPLLELADVAPDRLLIGSRVGGVYDGAGRRRHLPAVRAGRWVDESRVGTALASGRRRGRTWLWFAGGAGVVVAAVAVAAWAGWLPFVGDDGEQPAAAAPAAPVAHQGFNLRVHDADQARQSLRAAKALGANTVAIVVPQYVDRRDGTSIRSVAGRTPGDQTLRRVVRSAHGMGFDVSIEPVVGRSGAVQQRDFAAFAEGYRALLLEYAGLAADVHADELIVGAGLKGPTRRMAQDGRVGPLMERIGARFDGTVVYVAGGDELAHVPFWPASDRIGVEASGPGGLDKQQALALAQRYGKPILLTNVRLETPEQAQALMRAWDGVTELRGIYLQQLRDGQPVGLDPADWTATSG